MPTTVQNDKNEATERIIATIGELPASPAIVSVVMQLTSNLNSDVGDLGRHLIADQVLAAKVLKLSNSSFYGRSKTVSSINDAIIILGFHTIRSLVLASSVRGIFKSQKGNNIEGILWEHSLATAISCRMVAERLKHPGRDEAFLCGILHDIGKLILFRKFPDKYMEIFEKAPDSLMEFHELEQDMLGFDHMEVGEALLNKWNFPNEFVTAVVDHHRWTDKEEGKPLPLSWIVNYSNLCSGIIGSNIGNPARCETQWLEAVDRLGFVPDEATEVNNMLFDLFTEEKKIYD